MADNQLSKLSYMRTGRFWYKYQMEIIEAKRQAATIALLLLVAEAATITLLLIETHIFALP
jgi:hypothetical protein